MKKLSILLVLALIASGMVFAQPALTWSGLAEYEGAFSFAQKDDDTDTTEYDETYLFREPDFRLMLSVRIDDVNTAFFRLRANMFAASPELDATADNPALPPIGRTLNFDRAHLTTDWTRLFGLTADQVRITSRFGLEEWNLFNVAAVAGMDQGSFDKDIVYWGGRNQVDIMNMVSLAFTYSLQGFAQPTADPDVDDNTVELKEFFVNARGVFPVAPGTLRAEIAYGRTEAVKGAMFIGHDRHPSRENLTDAAAANLEENNGFMVFGASYTMPLTPEVTVAAGGAYNLELNPWFVSQWDFGARASYAVRDGLSAYGAFSLGGWLANADLADALEDGDGASEVLSLVKISTGVAFQMFGADLGMVLYTGGNAVADGEDDAGFITAADADGETEALAMFNALDISAFVRVGVATFRIGYLYTPEFTQAFDALHTDADQNSLYFRVIAPF